MLADVNYMFQYNKQYNWYINNSGQTKTNQWRLTIMMLLNYFIGKQKRSGGKSDKLYIKANRYDS